MHQIGCVMHGTCPTPGLSQSREDLEVGLRMWLDVTEASSAADENREQRRSACAMCFREMSHLLSHSVLHLQAKSSRGLHLLIKPLIVGTRSGTVDYESADRGWIGIELLYILYMTSNGLSISIIHRRTSIPRITCPSPELLAVFKHFSIII